MASSAIPRHFLCVAARNTLPRRSLLPLNRLSSTFTSNPTATFVGSVSDTGASKPLPDIAGKIHLLPPFDPFYKQPVAVDHPDPSNLRETFHILCSEGLSTDANHMFDALSKDGHSMPAIELLAVLVDQGLIPVVVTHTIVLEAFASVGGLSRETVLSFDRMLASGVTPTVYSYGVLVKGLARDGMVEEVRLYLLEMMRKGLGVDAGVYVSVFAAYVGEGRLEEVRKVLVEMRAMGFVPDESAVRGADWVAGTDIAAYFGFAL